MLFMCPKCGETEIMANHNGNFVRFTCVNCKHVSDYDDFYTECEKEETEGEIVIRIKK